MFTKNVKFTRFGSFFRRSLSLIVLLVMSGNFVGGALPVTSEPVLEVAPVEAEEIALMPAALPSTAVAGNARALPADVAALPELVERRTADSATFRAGEDRYVTILGTEAMHYQDQDGAWQVVDPAFRPVEDTFVVEHNAIRSRVAFTEARLSAAAGTVGVAWQATALGTGRAGRFTPLAEALDEPQNFARKYDADRVLRYDGNWSDPSISEEIVSAPGSLEHLLVLSEAPQVRREPQYLEMQATLKLLFAAELWADGQVQTGTFQTDGGLEIRDLEGNVGLVFDPVVAFERDRPAFVTAGTYVVEPSDEPNTWLVTVRTPWTWWADPQRQFPAVIDPTMHVLKSTGYANGMAWVANPTSGNPDTSDSNLNFGEMVLGSWYASGQYQNFVQFNSIPFLLTNDPISLTAAYLDIEPAYARMPYYSESAIDWEMLSMQQNVSLYDLGQCPGDCGGFSLTAEPAGFDWNNVPQGSFLSKKVIATPPVKGGGQTVTTTWNVTGIVRAWNQQNPRPADGPAFRLVGDTSCSNTSFEGDNAFGIPHCTRLVVRPGGARLRIEYSVLPLVYNQSILNDPGVPSFYEGVFADTSHPYHLSITAGFDHWRAVAARGNHAIEPAAPTWTGLKLVDVGLEPVELVNGSVQSADETAVILMDDHNPDNTLGAADLTAEVTASNQNSFASDEGRNYRVEYQRANAWDVPYSTWTTRTISFRTDRLISLGEFELAYGDSVMIRVTAPTTFPLELALAAPTSGADKSNSALGNVNLDKGFEPEGYSIRSKAMTFVQTEGVWALAMINQGRPIPDSQRPTYGIAHEVTVEFLRCAMGSAATAKWDCQPIIIPQTGTERAEGLGVTVYSEGGFTGDPDSDTWCTTNEGTGAPFIGPDVDGRWIVVEQGSVCRSGNTISTTAESGIGLAISIPVSPTLGKVLPTLVYGSTDLYPLPEGRPTGVVIRSGDSGRLVPAEDVRRNIKPLEEHWSTVLTETADYIDTADVRFVGDGTINAQVTVDAAEAPVPLSFAVPWTLYPDEAALDDYVFDAQPVQAQGLPQPAMLASLELRIIDVAGEATGILDVLDAYKLETNVNAGQFRADRGKVTQDAKLGGATKTAAVVIQPPGAQRLPASEKVCSYEGALTSCLDLRRDDYAWDNSEGDKNLPAWELPDVHIEDSAGMMMFSRPGELQIFSTDHPYAMASVDQSFSFDTFGASVSVSEEPCTEGGPVVTVVRGSASIGLPSMGDDGSGGGPSITTNFKLCSAELRQAQLILEIPTPGIPVGNSGLGVNLIGGTVIIDPDYTQIEFQLGFQTLDGVTLSNGLGAVMIDTRGLFQLEASAKIVGILNADLLLQVAWNPMDILFEAGVNCCGGIISGGLRMHAWLGQGWQHMYSWLPDDDAFHFTGSIQATLRIPKGYIADLGIMELPPFTFTIGIKIAIGEFCTNDSCTSYDWGMSGVLSVCGYDVGLYVDSSGFDLILGSDDHVLIDQFGGSLQQRVAGVSLATTAPTPPYEVHPPGYEQEHMLKLIVHHTPVDDWPVESAGGYGCTGTGTPVHVCPFTVEGSAGRALFSVGWENGDLDVALVAPDNSVIVPTNAISYGITVSETSTSLVNQVTFGVPRAAIVSGTWQVQMSNVITDPTDPFQTNYQILFATEPPPPALVWNSPVVSGTTPGAGDIVDLEWTALRGGQPLSDNVKMELVYVPVASKPLTSTEISGTLIVNRIAANAGSYAWNTQGLASGEYAVGARVDDRFSANGFTFAWAPGTIVISDTTPPPVPHILGQIDLKDALIVLWERDTDTLDLAGYLVEYTIPEWDELGQLSKVRRIFPHAEDQWPMAERIRLGGLLSGLPTTVCVRAYDASYNVSDCEEFTHTLTLEPPDPLGAPQRLGTVGGTANKEPFMRVTWWTPPTGVPAGYYLSYQLSGCILPGAESLADQGTSPIDVMDTHVYTLTGLTEGQTYRIAVNAYDAIGYVGPGVEGQVMFIDPTDANADGLPDAWAELYHIYDGADGDKDNDGLTNGEEYDLQSNPLRADSDKDGYDDEEEVAWGTDLCGAEHPPYHGAPKLTLAGSTPQTFEAATNQYHVATQTLHVLNLGGGTLDWTVEASEPWIVLDRTGGSGMGTLSIGVDPVGLVAGHYTGTLRIRNVSPMTVAVAQMDRRRVSAAQEEAIIDVALDVLPPKDFTRYVYLPLILR